MLAKVAKLISRLLIFSGSFLVPKVKSHSQTSIIHRKISLIFFHCTPRSCDIFVGSLRFSRLSKFLFTAILNEKLEAKSVPWKEKRLFKSLQTSSNEVTKVFRRRPIKRKSREGSRSKKSWLRYFTIKLNLLKEFKRIENNFDDQTKS